MEKMTVITHFLTLQKSFQILIGSAVAAGVLLKMLG